MTKFVFALYCRVFAKIFFKLSRNTRVIDENKVSSFYGSQCFCVVIVVEGWKQATGCSYLRDHDSLAAVLQGKPKSGATLFYDHFHLLRLISCQNT